MRSDNADPAHSSARQKSGEPTSGLPGTRTDVSPEITPSKPPAGGKLVLYHDGQSCVAEVPELPGCVVRGTDYSDVLKRIRQALSDWSDSLRWGSPAQKKILAMMECFSLPSDQNLYTAPLPVPIKTRLVRKFGCRSNRELAACIGIVCADAPIMLSSAMAGNGTRKVRCAIAIALNELPSSLWPSRAPNLNRSDDASYYLLIRERESGLSRPVRVD